MKTLCVLLVVLGAALAEKPCCYPDTFVTGKGTTVGYSRLWKKGAVHAVGMLAFDYPGQKAAEILTMYEYPEELQLHVIYRYDQQKQYMIDMKTSKCYESPLLEKMENCVYANATFYGDAYLGNKQMNITNFGFFVKDRETEGQVSLSVSTEGCLPGSFIFVGRADGVDMTYISGFYDYVPSIENPGQYFDVPAACSTAGSKGSPPFIKPRLGVFV